MPVRDVIDGLAELVGRHVEVGPGALTFERVSTGHFNTTYFFEGADRPLVLRIAPPDDAGFVFYERGMMAQEPTIHALVRERTDVPVPEIIAYDRSRQVIDRDYLLMERLRGVPLAQFACTQAQMDSVLEQVGRYLRQIHEITAEQYGYLGEHHCMEAQRDWESAFRVMWGKLIDDVAAAGYYDDDQVTWAKGLLEKHISHFRRHVTSRLLHMDIWSQNILVDEDAHVTGLVDFDRALWGDKEIEFAVLDYCGVSEPAFWRGYGLERDTSLSAEIRRTFYLLYEVQKYIVIYHHRNREFARAERYKEQSLAMLRELA